MNIAHSLLAVLLTSAFAGCSAGPTSTKVAPPDEDSPSSDGGGGDRDASPTAACEPGVGKARGPTQSCCPAFGVDACGPMLVCAALDGRTVPVCYPERSREFGASCTSDALCMTKHCNAETQTCDGGPGCPPCGTTTTCTVEIYRQTCGEPMRAPDETRSRTIELTPNGPNGSCVFEAPRVDPSAAQPQGEPEIDFLVMCQDDDPRVKWSVEGTGSERTLVFDQELTWGGGGGGCYTDLYRYRCAL